MTLTEARTRARLNGLLAGQRGEPVDRLHTAKRLDRADAALRLAAASAFLNARVELVAGGRYADDNLRTVTGRVVAVAVVHAGTASDVVVLSRGVEYPLQDAYPLATVRSIKEL
jgi:phosphopantothenate synthetase